MPYLDSLEENAVLLDLFRAFPATAKPLVAYHEALMRGPSPLSLGERELIASFVSGLNACSYCHGVHRAVAARFGIDETHIGRLLDGDFNGVRPPLRPILRFVSKLTTSPSKVTQTDADAVFAAGWNEQALHDAVSVCALFNFMNRLVDGLGIEAGTDYFARAGERIQRIGYGGLSKLIDEKP